MLCLGFAIAAGYEHFPCRDELCVVSGIADNDKFEGQSAHAGIARARQQNTVAFMVADCADECHASHFSLSGPGWKWHGHDGRGVWLHVHLKITVVSPQPCSRIRRGCDDATGSPQPAATSCSQCRYRNCFTKARAIASHASLTDCHSGLAAIAAAAVD